MLIKYELNYPDGRVRFAKFEGVGIVLFCILRKKHIEGDIGV